MNTRLDHYFQISKHVMVPDDQEYFAMKIQNKFPVILTKNQQIQLIVDYQQDS